MSFNRTCNMGDRSISKIETLKQENEQIKGGSSEDMKISKEYSNIIDFLVLEETN